MTTVAFIPVRGGSKSIPGKNIKNLAGRPLLHWTLEAAARTEEIDTVYVSSDSRDILDVAAALNHPKVVLLERPSELATDEASTEDALLHFAERHSFVRVLLVQATSPLTTSRDLQEGLQTMDRLGVDSLLSVTHEHRFRWRRGDDGRVQPENYDPVTRPRRQDWQGELVENGAFYITTREGLLASKCRLSGSVGYHVMSPHTSFEIDTPDDWEILAALTTSRHRLPGHEGKVSDTSHIRLLVTDVDGVLTDAGMYYGPEGEALKKFNTKDGMGMALFRAAGRRVAIVTGENSPAVAKRAEKLKVEDVHLGIKDKLPVVRAIADKHGLSLDQVAYMGDDLNDLEVMQHVGLPGCPCDANERIVEVSKYVAKTSGGHGCLREFIQWLLDEPASVDAAKKANL